MRSVEHYIKMARDALMNDDPMEVKEFIRAIQRDAFDAGAEAVKQLAKLHCDEYGASDARDAIEEINPKHLVARP